MITKEQAHDAFVILNNYKKQLAEEIKSGNHKQFIYNSKKEQVECRCGHHANFLQSTFVCSTITAYSCEYNK